MVPVSTDSLVEETAVETSDEVEGRPSQSVILVWGFIPAGDHPGPTDSRRAFYFPLNYLKTCRSGAVPGRELVPEITFYTQKTYLRGMTHVCLPSICPPHLPLTCLPPSEGPNPYPLLLSSGWHISFNCLPVGEPIKSLRGSHTYKIKFVFLLLIRLMLV